MPINRLCHSIFGRTLDTTSVIRDSHTELIYREIIDIHVILIVMIYISVNDIEHNVKRIDLFRLNIDSIGFRTCFR